MSDLEQPTWEYEEADPSVGIFGEGYVHTCTENAEGEFGPAIAEVVSSTVWDVHDGLVAEQRLYRCPACGATTTARQDWPAAMFEM